MAYKKQKSLQAIEDYYYRKGLRGHKLRRATAADRDIHQRKKFRGGTCRFSGLISVPITPRLRSG